jgi:hypothetical protein
MYTLNMHNALLNRLRLLKSYAFGSQYAGAGPPDALIEVTSHCNLACPECRRTELVGKPGHMKWEVFESALRSGSGHLELAFLFGWGEPLLWPHLFQGIQSARKQGIRTSVSTNITMLKGELARKMASCGPDILTLAMDSHVKEIYEKYRSGADFDEVYGNLKEFLRESRQVRSRSHLVLQMICSPEASKTAGDYKTFSKQFPDAEIRYRRFRPARPAGDAAPQRRPCPVLWRGPAYVRSDGRVFPCCILQDQELGNVLQTDLRTLWNSEKMRQLRLMHSTGRIHELKECSTCYHSDPQEYSRLSAMAGFLCSSYWARRFIPLSERLRLMGEWIRSTFRRQTGSVAAFVREVNERKGWRWLKPAAGLVVVIVLLLFKVKASDIGVEMSRSIPKWILLAGALHTVGLLLSSYRWQLLLSVQSVQVPMRGLMRSYLVAGFFNCFLPTRVAGDIYRVVDSRKYSHSLSAPLAVILVEGGFSVCGLFLIGAAALTFYPRVQEIRLLTNALFGLSLSGVAFAIFSANTRCGDWLKKKTCRLPERAGRKLLEVFDVLRHFSKAKAIMSSAFLLSVLLQANVILYYYFICKGLGISLSLIQVCIIMPIIICIQLIPLTPNGIGVREVTFLYLLGHFLGVAPAQALSVCSWDYILTFIYAAAGGVFYLTGWDSARLPISKVHDTKRLSTSP